MGMCRSRGEVRQCVGAMLTKFFQSSLRIPYQLFSSFLFCVLLLASFFPFLVVSLNISAPLRYFSKKFLPIKEVCPEG